MKTKLLFLLSLLWVFGGLHAHAQQDLPTATSTQIGALSAVYSAGVSDHKEVWRYSVQRLNAKVHKGPDQAKILAAKQLSKIATNSQENTSGRISNIQSPVLGLNYEANWSLNSAPPDNTMAISNAGIVVTANNDGVEYYNASGNFLDGFLWSSFFNDPLLTSVIYDPIVLYDSDADRFVMVVLHGSTSSTSQVLLCFSKTNNPNNVSNPGWWVYKLNGNPLNNSTWFDYPNLGISTQDVFITGNLFNNSDVFNQAIVYQMPKAQGFLGGTINNITTWSNLSSSPFVAFTLEPASSGKQGNTGPGMYFVSSASGGDNRLRLWHINNSIGNNPQMTSTTINVPAYSPVSDSPQPGTNNVLDNGDCRLMQAFIQDGLVHYVFHTNIGNNWNGIRYGRINVQTNAHVSSNFGFMGSADCSYPAVASVSTDPGNQSVVIAFLRASASIFPEVRVVTCNHSLQWSASTLVKAGTTFVNFLSSTNERWGDYTGAARRYNSNPPRVWVAGCYGANVTSPNFPNTYKTWVAEVSGGTTAVGFSDEQSSITQTKVYPNPVYDFFKLEYSLNTPQAVSIQLLDAAGKRIKLFIQENQRVGEYRFVFDKADIAPGLYQLVVSGNESILHHEKLLISR